MQLQTTTPEALHPTLIVVDGHVKTNHVVAVQDEAVDGCWRLLTRLRGTTLHKLPSAHCARSVLEPRAATPS